MPEKPTVWRRLYDEIDWDHLESEIGDLIDAQADKAKIDAEVKAYLTQVAHFLDVAVDFDALINGPAEPIGDALEALDFGVIRGALMLVYRAAESPRVRLARRLGRLEFRRLNNGHTLSPKATLHLVEKIDRLRKRIAALPGRNE